jgi:hypothetical protein
VDFQDRHQRRNWDSRILRHHHEKEIGQQVMCVMRGGDMRPSVPAVSSLPDTRSKLFCLSSTIRDRTKRAPEPPIVLPGRDAAL